MNRLIKSTRSVYVPGSPGVPANPGQPALPARTVNTPVTTCGYIVDTQAMLAQGWKQVYVPASGYNPSYYRWEPPVGGNGQLIYKYACTTTYVVQNVPAQPYIPPTPGTPAVPSQFTIDKILGWNARGYSKKSVSGGVAVTFTGSIASIGIIAGLNPQPADSGYADIPFAFYLSQGYARIMEYGEIVDSPGAFDEGSQFKIQRYNGTITYFINGEQVRETPNSSEPMFFDVALYSGGDYIDDPDISGLTGSNGLLAPLASFSGNHTVCSARISFRALTSDSGTDPYCTVAVELAGLTGVSSNYGYTGSIGIFDALTSDAETSGLVPSLTTSDGVVIFLSGTSSGLTGEIASSAGVFSPLDGLSSKGTYAESAGVFAAFIGYSDEGDGNENASLSSSATAAAMFRTQSSLAVAINSIGQVTSVFAVDISINADIRSVAEGISISELTASLNSYMLSIARAESVSPLTEQNQAVWVVNTDNLGTTRYENYGFNSFAKIGGLYYGAKADGLYRLDGEDDDGEDINAMISFGKQTFGSSLKKGVLNAYIGMTSGGKMILKVIVEGASYVYAARDSDTNLKVQRFDIGKGISANYIEFEVYNQNGEDFELDTVEFTPVEMSRRI